MASSTRDHRSHLNQLFVRMHAVIRSIPRGLVATYGQVAELAGLPGGARVAAASLKSDRAARLPWQRVVGKASGMRGRIAIHDPVGAAVQRQLLAEEGVIVGDNGLIKLDVYGWLPTLEQAPGTRNPSTKRDGESPPTAPARAESGRAASPRRPLRSGSKRRA
jgi:methylated-DNA-protein-cysteine methyltransferase-like protein